MRSANDTFTVEPVSAIPEILGRGAIEREHHILAGPVSCRFDRGHDEVERFGGAGQIGGKATFVADCCRQPLVMQLFLERMENLRPHPHRIEQAVGANRHDHEFLKINGIIGMHPAVDDIHHRHGEDVRPDATDIAIERQSPRVGRSLCHRKRHAQNGICAQPRFVRRPVKRDHDRVDLALIFGVITRQRAGNLAIDRINRLGHALAQPRLAAVTQFHSFIRPRRCTRRNSGTPETTVFKKHVDFDRGVATTVNNAAGVDVENFGHVWLSKKGCGMRAPLSKRAALCK